MTEIDFTNRHGHWKNCLIGDDRNSVQNQLIQITWDFAIFNSINEALKLSPKAPEGGVKQNGMIHDFIARAFFELTLSRVRRVVDKYPLDGKKGVFSLGGLVADLKDSRLELTRERVFAQEGRPLDYRIIRDEHDQFVRWAISRGDQGSGIPIHLDWQVHEDRHRQWDELAGITDGTRNTQDLIHDSIFAFLLEKLETSTANIKTYVNKFIAHNATPLSRKHVGADEIVVTLKDLYTSVRTICEVASFISIYILGAHQISPLPIAQYEKFKYLDKPLVTPNDIIKLEAAWRSFESESHQWGSYTIKKLFEEMRQS